MKLVSLFILLMSLTLPVFGQSPISVTPLTLPAGSQSGEVTGNISSGQKISLDWAAQSSVAAFPSTRFEMFDGNHVFYRISLPAGSEMTITLTPEKGKLINLYALRQGVGETSVPPHVSSAISAEASYPLYANVGNGRKVSNADNGVRKVEFMSVGSPYSILIGVAGAQGARDGEYKLNVTTTGDGLPTNL